MNKYKDVQRSKSHHSLKVKSLLIFAVSNLFYAPLSFAVVSSNTGSNAFNGDYINSLIGADTFYSQGYTGSRAVTLSVDGGHIWNQHQTLINVSTFLDGRSLLQANGRATNDLGSFDIHATAVGHVLGGDGTFNLQKGIAYGTELWSGAVGTDFLPSNGALFEFSEDYAFVAPYEQALIDGVNGRKADVVNTSFGMDGTTNSIYARALDGMVMISGATSIVSAGNDGPSFSTVSESPGGYNSIVVGATGNDANGYSAVSDFSSRGPANYVAPGGNTVTNVRARIDIVAPGENLTIAQYGGATGSNKGGNDSTNGAINSYLGDKWGTSYAAPTVAGGASLLNDVAYDQFSSNANARNGQVIKAVLLNSADKLDGWNNGQATLNNVITTTQALDYTQGAGALNLTNAYHQFTGGTTDVAGLDGGNIESVGWDFGAVAENGSNDYQFDQQLAIGGRFTATLNWFVGRTYTQTNSGSLFSTADDYFTDLALQLYLTDNGSEILVAESDTTYLNTEHLSFDLLVTGNYLLRVNWEGERYDFSNNDSQQYGLAWAAVSAVPEPKSWMLMAGGILLLAMRRAKKARLEAFKYAR